MLQKAQKEDIHIDRKGSTAKKYISIEFWKYNFLVVASIYHQNIFFLKKKAGLLNCLQIEDER